MKFDFSGSPRRPSTVETITITVAEAITIALDAVELSKFKQQPTSKMTTLGTLRKVTFSSRLAF